MKYLIYILIAYCLFLLMLVTGDHGKEIRELREGYRLHSEEIMALRGQIKLIKADIKHMNRPFTKVIPIDGGWLGIREEK